MTKINSALATCNVVNLSAPVSAGAPDGVVQKIREIVCDVAFDRDIDVLEHHLGESDYIHLSGSGPGAGHDLIGNSPDHDTAPGLGINKYVRRWDDVMSGNSDVWDNVRLFARSLVVGPVLSYMRQLVPVIIRSFVDDIYRSLKGPVAEKIYNQTFGAEYSTASEDIGSKINGQTNTFSHHIKNAACKRRADNVTRSASHDIAVYYHYKSGEINFAAEPNYKQIDGMSGRTDKIGYRIAKNK